MKNRILVVEDFESIRDYLAKFLASKGYETLEATNGEEALQVLATEKVDLVLSDYNMPELNGIGLLERIKAQPETQNIPVIFLTTEKSLEKMKEAKKAGLFAWVAKPYKYETFIATINRALNNG